MTKFLIFAAAAIALLYVGACILLFAYQDSFLFHPLRNDAALSRKWRTQRFEIAGKESVIEAWSADNAAATTDTIVLYFGGNGEDALYMLEEAKRINAKRMIVANYRGYGAHAGKPSQDAFFSDALAIYDYAVAQPNASADRIIVMGRSIGSGVATFVAANRKLRGVILVTPYDSIVSVAQVQFAYFPVRWLLKNKFPSDQFASQIHTPVIVIAGEQDQVIPIVHARRLFDAWAGPKHFHALDKVGHNDIEQHRDYYSIVNKFLEQRP